MLLLPADSLRRSEVETDYQSEWQAAQTAGFQTAIFDIDALTRGDTAQKILRLLPPSPTTSTAILRSWMLSVENYARLESLLGERSITLLTNSQSYEFAHHFPKFYPFLDGHTPHSQVVSREEFERDGDLDFAPIRAALKRFGEAPLVVKDWVKSQKHHWHEACFIPRASDFASAEMVVRRFIELQGDFLVGGLVLREFLELKSVGTHPQSGLPLTAEWRAFVFDGEPFFVAPYWDGADYGELKPDLDFISERAQAIPSRFFSLDIAQTTGGEWVVIEIGDGQVSGLPSVKLAREFYAGLNLARRSEA